MGEEQMAREEEMADSEQAELEKELESIRHKLETIKNKSKALVDHRQGLSDDSQRLWQAVEAASAVFRAVVPGSVEEDCNDDEQELEAPRARSAGALRTPSGSVQAAPPALKKSRTPRTSLTGKERRVSFGDEADARKQAACEEDNSPRSDSRSNLSETEHAEPEPEEPSQHTESQGVSKILDWGLTEFIVPPGTTKVGMHFKMPPEPLLVHRVTEGSWAEIQGICAGDTVHSVDGKRAEGMPAEHFVSLMKRRPLKLTIERLPKLWVGCI